MIIIRIVIAINRAYCFWLKWLNHWIGQTILATSLVAFSIAFKVTIQILIAIGIICALRAIYEVKNILRENFDNSNQCQE